VPAYPGVVALAAAALAFSLAPALAEGCGRADALGTARVMNVDPAAHARVGSFHFDDGLPLADKEVILTFDDGPLPAYTASILRTLAEECVRATFFVVGRMARANPEWVRRAYNAGHSIGTHTLSHRPLFNFLPEETAIEEIERGIVAVGEALGEPRALAPFFRFPGLRTSAAMERYLAGRGVMIWSIDLHGDDWRAISADEVVERLMHKLARKRRGIVLLHDIQARTALALPKLLRRLKAGGYRVVHAVPAGERRPQRLPEPAVPMARPAGRSAWPLPAAIEIAGPPELPAPSPASFGFPELFGDSVLIAAADGETLRLTTAALLRPPQPAPGRKAVWPEPAATPAGGPPALAVPSLQSLDLTRPLDWQADWRAPAPTRSPRPHRPRPSPVAEAPAEPKARPDGRAAETRAWPLRLNWIH
jgi:peptidoglycan-N-acetylglucosamine deacetylase